MAMVIQKPLICLKVNDPIRKSFDVNDLRLLGESMWQKHLRRERFDFLMTRPEGESSLPDAPEWLAGLGG
jgi:hypothetical protein